MDNLQRLKARRRVIYSKIQRLSLDIIHFPSVHDPAQPKHLEPLSEASTAKESRSVYLHASGLTDPAPFKLQGELVGPVGLTSPSPFLEFLLPSIHKKGGPEVPIH